MLSLIQSLTKIGKQPPIRIPSELSVPSRSFAKRSISGIRFNTVLPWLRERSREQEPTPMCVFLFSATVDKRANSHLTTPSRTLNATRPITLKSSLPTLAS